MRVAATITTATITAERRVAPNGWWLGWIKTVLFANTVCTLVAYCVFTVDTAFDMPRALIRRLAIGNLANDLSLMWLLTIMATIVPLTLFYVGIRLLARRIKLTPAIRAVLGVSIGPLVNGSVIAYGVANNPMYFSRTTFHDRHYLPLIIIQGSPLVVALVARRGWFGVP